MAVSLSHNFLPLLVFAANTAFCYGALFTIDLGSENMKVAVVKAGRIPISIAINEMSKRKSPALVALSDGDRLLSEEAAGIIARYPDRVYARSRDLVGRPAKDLIDLLRDNYLDYNVSSDEDRSTLKITSHDGSFTVYAEELVGLLLGYARELATMHAKSSLKDAVISVPPFFGQSQRQAILDAARIVDLNVMSLVHEHSAVAIQYGIDLDLSNSSKTVLLYDMGANSVYAALVQYTAYTVKEKGKNVSQNQFQVKSVRWDEELGGQTFELRLLEHFADEFNEKAKLGEDVRSSFKAMAKLRKEVKRSKEILSANTEAPFNVESLFQDVDFRTSISRDKFEELCEDLWERAVLPVKRVLADTGLRSQDIDAVELVGGATRMPRLQIALSSFLGNRPLDRHLDADESVALGASLLAANLSDGFKLNRNIGMVDGVTYGVQFRIHVEAEESARLQESGVQLLDPQPLFPRLKRLPVKLTRSLKYLKEDFSVELLYELEDDYLPPTFGSRQISLLEVTGLSNVSLKYSRHNLSSPVKTSLTFALSRSGLASLDRAEAVVEYHEWVDVPVFIPPPANVSAAGNQSAVGHSNSTDSGEEEQSNSAEESSSSSSAGPEGSSSTTETAAGNSTVGVEAEAPSPVVYEKKLRKRTVRVPLKVTDISDGIAMPLSLSALSGARARLQLLEERERKKREVAEAKNSLESFIYSTKDKLESDEDLIKVSTPDERSSLDSSLDKAAVWLEDEGETAGTADFRRQLNSLQEESGPMFTRKSELRARPAALEEASKFVTWASQKISGWEKLKPWINETDRSSLLSEVTSLKKWLDESTTLQKKKKLTEVPAFLSATVLEKLEKLQDKVMRTDKIHKPRPKPTPKNATNKNSTTGGAEPKQDGESDGNTENVGKNGNEKNSSNEGQHDEL